MNFLILGAGFIGTKLAESLLADDNRVVIFDHILSKSLRYLKERGGEVVIGDFSEINTFRHIFQGVDVIFHLVSTTMPKKSNDDPLFDIDSNLCSH